MHRQLEALERGKGDAVVLISGLGGKGSFWQPVAEQLNETMRVVTFDHPGTGRAPLDGKPSIKGIAQSVVDILDKENIHSAHIIGHSTGSLAAQTLGLDFPERVSSIVLSSGWAKPDQRFRDFFAYRKYVLNHLGGEAYKALTDLTAWPSTWYEDHFARNITREFHSSSDIDVAMVNDRIEMLLGYNRADEIKALAEFNVLIIGAQDDYIIPYIHSQHLASLIPSSRLVELSGGHFAPVTRTNEYVDILKNFWEITE